MDWERYGEDGEVLCTTLNTTLEAVFSELSLKARVYPHRPEDSPTPGSSATAGLRGAGGLDASGRDADAAGRHAAGRSGVPAAPTAPRRKLWDADSVSDWISSWKDFIDTVGEYVDSGSSFASDTADGVSDLWDGVTDLAGWEGSIDTDLFPPNVKFVSSGRATCHRPTMASRARDLLARQMCFETHARLSLHRPSYQFHPPIECGQERPNP